MVAIKENPVKLFRETKDNCAEIPKTANVVKSWSHLMEEGLQMKVLTQAEDKDSFPPEECQHQDAVLVDFVGRFATNPEQGDGPIFHEAKDWLIVIGEKQVCPALEMGIRFMKAGQTALIWSEAKYACGLGSRRHPDGYELPSNASVRYEITVKSIVSSDTELDPEALKLKLAQSNKEIGNDIFQYEWTGADHDESPQRCLRLYGKAAEEMLHLSQTSTSTEVQQEARSILLLCLNNIVAVYMRSKQYHKAKEAAVQVLTHDPDNLKALTRAAHAALLDPAGSLEEAEAALRAATEVAGEDNSTIISLQVKLQRTKQKYRKTTKAMFRRMRKGI